MPCYGAAGYCGSKHAVEGFYGSLRLEMQPFGVGKGGNKHVRIREENSFNFTLSSCFAY